jgi:hypothetical protein
MALAEQSSPRVPQQLVDPDGSEKEETGEEQETSDDSVQEFSSLGAGSIVGFTAPLGMSAKNMRTPKPRVKKKKSGLTA